MCAAAYTPTSAFRALSAVRLVLLRVGRPPRPEPRAFTCDNHYSTRARNSVTVPAAPALSSTQARWSSSSKSTGILASPDLGPDPLNPPIPTCSLGLPLEPLPPPIPTVHPVAISREALHRLHRLSALNPPKQGSEEETELLAELGGLIGLMEIVKGVDLDLGQGQGKAGYGELLGRGVGELMLDFDDATGTRQAVPTTPGDKMETQAETQAGLESSDSASASSQHGKALLQYATRRVGDFYASRITPRLK